MKWTYDTGLPSLLTILLPESKNLQNTLSQLFNKQQCLCPEITFIGKERMAVGSCLHKSWSKLQAEAAGLIELCNGLLKTQL